MAGSDAGAQGTAPPVIPLNPFNSMPVNPAPLKISNNLKVAVRAGRETTLYLVSGQTKVQSDQRYPSSELNAFRYSRAVPSWGALSVSDKLKSASEALKAFDLSDPDQNAADILAVKVSGSGVEFLTLARTSEVRGRLLKQKFAAMPSVQSLEDEIYSITAEEQMQANIEVAHQHMSAIGKLPQVGSMNRWSETSLGFAASNPKSLARFFTYLRDVEKLKGTAELVGPIGKIMWTGPIGDEAESFASSKAKELCDKAAQMQISCVDWGYVVRFKSN